MLLSIFTTEATRDKGPHMPKAVGMDKSEKAPPFRLFCGKVERESEKKERGRKKEGRKGRKEERKKERRKKESKNEIKKTREGGKGRGRKGRGRGGEGGVRSLLLCSIERP